MTKIKNYVFENIYSKNTPSFIFSSFSVFVDVCIFNFILMFKNSAQGHKTESYSLLL